MKPHEVLADPEFHALPHIERLKVLYAIDPDYRKLHPAERWKVVKSVGTNADDVASPKPVVGPPVPPPPTDIPPMMLGHIPDIARGAKAATGAKPASTSIESMVGQPSDIAHGILSGLNLAPEYGPVPTYPGGFNKAPVWQAKKAPGPIREIDGKPVESPRIKDMIAGQVVFHGSPHTFDKFDAAHIGTGQGAQTYGHGLYFAENPDVAKSYISQVGNVLKNAKTGVGINPKEMGLGPDATKALMESLNFNKSKDQILREIDGKIEQSKFWDQQDVKAGIAPSRQQFINELTAARPAIAHPDIQLTPKSGPLYTADIPDHHIEKMLDWDKPMSQQSAGVRETLRAIGEKTSRTDPVGGDMILYFVNNDKASGAAVYQTLTSQLGDGLVSDGRKEASRLLDAHGIPGIKYLDEGSREIGKGTRNIVVFDPKIVKTLTRNGTPISAPIPPRKGS